MSQTAQERVERVQFHGRIPPKLHRFLKIWGAKNGVSINDALVEFAFKGIRSEGFNVENP